MPTVPQSDAATYCPFCFGRLPAHLRQRVFAADVQSLDTWFDRAIDAADLQSGVDPKRIGAH
jgi:hypothetical protein